MSEEGVMWGGSNPLHKSRRENVEVGSVASHTHGAGDWAAAVGGGWVEMRAC